MKELIEFISQYDPEYRQKIRGATEAEIAELERLVGRKLPTRYKDFLRHMGRGMGDFEIPETNLSIDRIERFYRGKGRERVPARYVYIAAHEEDPYSSYYYDCVSAEETADCAIIRAEIGQDFSSADNLLPAFPSLQDMLFLFSFQVKRMSYLPHRAFLQTSWGSPQQDPGQEGTLTLEELEELMPRLGFQKLPYTTPRNPMFERGDAAFYAHRPTEEAALSAEIAASSEKERNRLLEIIRDNTLLS